MYKVKLNRLLSTYLLPKVDFYCLFLGYVINNCNICIIKINATILIWILIQE